MNTVTIIYNEDLQEEVIECVELGSVHTLLMFYDEFGRPFRMVNSSLISDVFIEYEEDDGMQIDFEMDERDVH